MTDMPATATKIPARATCPKCGNVGLMTLVRISWRGQDTAAIDWRCGECGHEWTLEETTEHSSK